MIDVATVKDLIARAIRKLENRAQGMLRRATLTGWDNSTGIPQGQYELTKDENVTCETISMPGLSYRPAPGMEAIVGAIGGNPSNLVAWPNLRGSRLVDDELEEGEAAMYIGNPDQVIRLKTDSSIYIQSGTSGCSINLASNGEATITSVSSGAQAILKENGDIVMIPAPGGKIYLGEDGTPKKVALADDVDARLASIRTTFNLHNHPTAPVGPVSTPSSPIVALAPTGATLVNAK